MLKKLILAIGKLFGADIVDARRRWGVSVWNDVERLNRGQAVTVILDIGANSGQTAVALANRFSSALIYSFEPVTKTFAALQATASQNSHIRPYNVACGSTSGRQSMVVYPDNPLVNSLVPDAPYTSTFLPNADIEKTEITVTTVDEFAAGHGLPRIDIIKIDTEGYDLEVIKGASITLKTRSVRFVVCEFFEVRGLVPINELLEACDFVLAGLYIDYLAPDKNYFAVRNALFAKR